MVMNRIDIQYRGHRIIANDTGAMVYGHELKYKIDGTDKTANLSKAKLFIDSKYKQRQENRRAPNIGTIDDYCEAISGFPLAKHEITLLSTHRNAPLRKMTASELSACAGWQSVGSANVHYGKLGRRIAEHLNLEIIGNDDLAWTGALANYDQETRQWEMHEELALALDRLNII